MKLFIFTFIITLTMNISANDKNCFPDSKLSFPIISRGQDHLKSRTEKIISEFKKINNQYIRENFKKDLIVDHDWQESRINALATFDLDDNPIIKILGGVSRYPGISEDAIRLILCHELGHFLGGDPKKLRGDSQIPSWSSAEGQADYFSTAVCFRGFDSQSSITPSNKTSLNLCQFDQNCLRMAQAANELMIIWAKVKAESKFPSIDEVDASYVYQTNLNYPSLQCRLDTLVNGARCDYKRDEFLNNSQIECKNQSDLTVRPPCWFFE